MRSFLTDRDLTNPLFACFFISILEIFCSLLIFLLWLGYSYKSCIITCHINHILFVFAFVRYKNAQVNIID